MKANVAGWDRIVRVVLGIALLYLGLAGVVTGAGGIILDVLGVVFVLTGAVGFCPLYAALGLRTAKKA